MDLPVSGIIFSKDRALQLDATLASFYFHCRDAGKTPITVLYKASSALHQKQYKKLEALHPQARFLAEDNFKEQVLNLLSREYVLFLVDDNIFVKDFFLSEILHRLAEESQLIGCSLRLGRNTTFCYSLNQNQSVPPFSVCASSKADALNTYVWPGTEADFNYVLEVSSSVYRSADILPLLRSMPFSNPNSLEGLLSQKTQQFARTHPKMLCFDTSRTFCNPVNKVQQAAPANRAGVVVSYSAEDLAVVFERDGRIDVQSYAGHCPKSCHEEVELKVRYPVQSNWQEEKKIENIKVSEPSLISVVIPCYKQAHFLRDAVESVVRQTYPVWECFIVNDGSPDDTSAVARQMIEEFTGRRITLIEKENEGLAEARNTAIREAKGTWVLPLDSDDKFHPTFMQKAINETVDGSVNIVSANLQCFGAKQDVLQVFPFSQQQLLQGNMFPYASLYRRALWEKFGGYIPIIPFGAEDYNFWVTCSGELSPRRIAEPLFFYRKHEGASMVDAVISHQYEVDACLHTCHPSLYSPEALMRDHQVLSLMHDDTVAAIGRTINRFPQYSQPYLWRGLWNLAGGHWRQAERDFITATRLSTAPDWQPWFALVRLYIERKDPTKAKAAAAETLQRSPQHPARKQLQELCSMKAF